MRKLLLYIALLFHTAVLAQVEKYIPPAPDPPVLVNDFTGKFLIKAQKEALEKKLIAYDDSTSNQVVIVVLETLDGYDANEYATALGRKWGVGNKEFNNGIVILISTGAKEGDRDAYIAVGYGLEGAIPDVTAKAIVENELIPHLKTGNYYRGLDETTDAVIKAAAGEYKAPARYGSGNIKEKIGVGTIIIIIIILVILLAIRNNGGTYVSRGGYGGWTGGGGWSGGGRSSGGGFGGFGGGSFGGGGAGGKW